MVPCVLLSARLEAYKLGRTVIGLHFSSLYILFAYEVRIRLHISTHKSRASNAIPIQLLVIQD